MFFNKNIYDTDVTVNENILSNLLNIEMHDKRLYIWGVLNKIFNLVI